MSSTPRRYLGPAVLMAGMVLAGRAAEPLQRAPGAPSGAASRAHRVETGLLPAVIVASERPSESVIDRLRELRVPGVVIAVVDGHAIDWVRAYGVRETASGERIEADTPLQFASISKPMTAVAVAALAQKGVVTLAAPANRYLREWKLRDGPSAGADLVTLERLLSHTAAISNPTVGVYGAGAVPSLSDVLHGRPPARPGAPALEGIPGSAFKYSGGGYTILQRIIEDVTGRSFADVMNDAILVPLGMRSSTFAQPPPSAVLARAATGYRFDGQAIAGKAMVLPEAAAGGLWSTAGDVARFVAEIGRSATGRKGARFGSGLIGNVLRVRAGEMGLGIYVRGSDSALRISHGGSNPGFRSRFMAYPYLGKGVVIASNSDLAPLLIDEIVRAVAAAYAWPDTFVRRIPAVAGPGDPDAYAGSYRYLPTRKYRIVARGGRLYGMEDREFENLLLPLGDDRFVSERYGTEIDVVRDTSGQITSLRLVWPDDPQTYTAQREP